MVSPVQQCHQLSEQLMMGSINQVQAAGEAAFEAIEAGAS